MANTTDTTIPASEVAKTLINSANVLKKPENTTQAAEERAAKDEASAQAQIASLQKATASTQIKKQITRERPYRKTRNEQNFDSAKKNLDTYMTAPVGSPERIAAFINVMKTVRRQPTQALLDLILQSFTEHRGEVALAPHNALQGAEALKDDATSIVALRVLYDVMYQLSSPQAATAASRINVEMIRSVFRDDTITSWVSYKLRMLRRRTPR